MQNLKAEVMYRDLLQRNFCLCLYASVMQVLWGRGPDSFYFNFVLACTLMYASAEKKNIFLHDFPVQFVGGIGIASMILPIFGDCR